MKHNWIFADNKIMFSLVKTLKMWTSTSKNTLFSIFAVYKNMADAMKKHPQADVLINFASLRSAFESTMETMTYTQV